MSSPLNAVRLSGAALWLIVPGAAPLHAQTASQLAPHSFAPAAPPADARASRLAGAPPAEAPEGADMLFVTPGDVAVSGGLPRLAAQEAALRRRLVGRRVSVADLFAAAQALEAAYARAGYVLVRVIVPPQRLADGGTVRLTVVDGFVEQIDLTAVPRRYRRRLGHILAPLRNTHALGLGQIERRVELAGDQPGLTIRSALSPGTAPGATTLHIAGSARAAQWTIDGGNGLGAALGGMQVGAGLVLNNLLGRGEQVYLHAGGLPNSGAQGYFSHYSRNRAIAAGISLPIGGNGVVLTAEGVLARTTPLGDGHIQATDRFARFSLKMRAVAVRRRALSVGASLAFEAEDEAQDILVEDLAVPLSRDRLRVLRAGVDGSGRLGPRAAWWATVVLSHGIAALGARTAADATSLLPLSRQGADADFTKLEGSFGIQRSAGPVLLGLAGRVQTGFGGAMLHAEQFGIAGPGALSGFASGAIEGDSGAMLRGEVRMPLAGAARRGLGVEPYVFGAGGIVALASPSALEQAHVRALSYGAGVSGTVPFGPWTSAAIGIEYARQAGEAARDRVNLSFSLRL